MQKEIFIQLSFLNLIIIQQLYPKQYQLTKSLKTHIEMLTSKPKTASKKPLQINAKQIQLQINLAQKSVSTLTMVTPKFGSIETRQTQGKTQRQGQQQIKIINECIQQIFIRSGGKMEKIGREGRKANVSVGMYKGKTIQKNNRKINTQKKKQKDLTNLSIQQINSSKKVSKTQTSQNTEKLLSKNHPLQSSKNPSSLSKQRAQKSQPHRSHGLYSSSCPSSPIPPIPKKFSQPHLSLLIEQQKSLQLKQILQSSSLKKYYNTLLSLWMIMYNAGQIIISNLFQQKRIKTGLSGLKFVGVFFGIYELVMNQIYQRKLKAISRNLLRMGATPGIFQAKVEFITRKITLNQGFKNRIQFCFLDKNLDNFWCILLSRFKWSDQIEILQQMYETAPEKLAYWDFMSFVQNFLADEQFGTILKSYGEKGTKEVQMGKQIGVADWDQGFGFSYQFFVIEIFCFEILEMQRQQDSEDENPSTLNPKSQKSCQLI